MAVNPISVETTVARSPGVLEAVVGGDTVLMSADASYYFGLDAIGGEIWSQLASPARLGDLQTYCQRNFDGDPDLIASDVAEWVEQLLQNALLVKQL